MLLLAAREVRLQGAQLRADQREPVFVRAQGGAIRRQLGDRVIEPVKAVAAVPVVLMVAFVAVVYAAVLEMSRPFIANEPPLASVVTDRVAELKRLTPLNV